MSNVATMGVHGVFDRAYVINMASATERWQAVEKEFARIGIVPTRLDAVRGKDLTQDEREAMTTPGCATFCTPAIIGCAASHVKLWKQMLHDGVASALVCEDDVEFVDGFRELLTQYAAEFPADYDLVYLGCFGCTGDENIMTRVATTMIGATHKSRDVSEHVWVPPVAFSTHCYLLSAAGARKLLDAVDGRITTHIDKMMNRLIGKGAIAAYAVRPLLTRQDVSLAATSISTAKTPRGPSILLDKLRFAPEVTWGYALASPFCQAPLGPYGAYTVNLWSFIFFGSGAVAGLCNLSVAWALGFCMLLLLWDMLPFMQGEKDTIIAVFANIGLALLGWLAGIGVRTLAVHKRNKVYLTPAIH